MFTIRKEFSFEASHQLLGLPVNHPCSKLHGHSYRIVIELHGQYMDSVGMLYDYRELDKIKLYIDKMLDHKHLNDVIIGNPTAEILAMHLYEVCLPIFPNLLNAIEVYETTKTSARYEQLSSERPVL